MNMKDRNRQASGHDEQNLAGTLISVGILGLILIVSWFAVFALFISR